MIKDKVSHNDSNFCCYNNQYTLRINNYGSKGNMEYLILRSLISTNAVHIATISNKREKEAGL